MHLTHLTGNLRIACAIDVLDTEFDNQPDTFFYFPVSLNFRLCSGGRHSNATKKIYILICFIKSLPKGNLIIHVLYNTTVPLKRTLENFFKFYFYGLKKWVAKCAVCAQFTCQKKNRHRLTRRVAKCPKLRANCASCKQTAPTTSHLGH